MKKMKELYLWAMNAKLFMGIYFAAIVLLSGILLACFGKESISIIVLLEIMVVSVFIALTQVFLLPDSTDFMRGIFFIRSLVWLILSGSVIFVIAHFGGWFAGLPIWSSFALALAMVAGCIAMLIGLRLEQESDTVHLNHDLEIYKQKEKEQK